MRSSPLISQHIKNEPLLTNRHIHLLRLSTYGFSLKSAPSAPYQNLFVAFGSPFSQIDPPFCFRCSAGKGMIPLSTFRDLSTYAYLEPAARCKLELNEGGYRLRMRRLVRFGVPHPSHMKNARSPTEKPNTINGKLQRSRKVSKVASVGSE